MTAPAWAITRTSSHQRVELGLSDLTGSRLPVFKIEWISLVSWLLRSALLSRTIFLRLQVTPGPFGVVQLDLLMLKLGAEPRMNHLRALQSGLGSLDRLEVELINKEVERDQFEQLREELIDQSRSRL